MNKGKSWSWGITAVYTVFALGTLSFVFFAMTQKVELVSSDYYKQEVEYQQQIDRQNRTNKIQNPVECLLSADKQTVEFRFPATIIKPEGKYLFYRPSESALDKEFGIALNEQGTQSISVASLAKGAWKVKIFWKSEGKDFYHESDIML